MIVSGAPSGWNDDSRKDGAMTFPKKIERPALAAAVAAACLIAVCFGCSTTGQGALDVIVGPPPPSAVEPVTDTIHGVKITDPYRWLEDQESPATREWIERQNAYTDSIVGQIPGRAELRAVVEKLVKTDAVSVPIERGGRYFYSRKGAEQPLSVIYVRKGLRGAERVLVDPHPMSDDHSVNANIEAISKDGRVLAYALRQGGQDESQIRFVDVASGADLPDRLPSALYFGLSIAPDGGGVYYHLFTPEGSRNYYHEMGTDTSADTLVFGAGCPPEKMAIASVSDDGRWLIGHVMEGTSGPIAVHLRDLANNGPWKTVIDDGRSRSMADVAGGRLYIQTDLDAPRGRVMYADANNPESRNWRELIPEDRSAVLEWSAPLGGKIVAGYLEDVQTVARVHDLEGGLIGEIAFDSIGVFDSIGSISAGSGSFESGEAFFTFSSLHVPPTIYRYDLESNEKEVWAAIDIPVDSESMTVKQVFYSSKDGTRVPMFVLHRKDLVWDHRNPTLITGYGGFGMSLTPDFSAFGAAWVEMGGVFCVANLRGGGEYGDEWHRAGMLENKQNVFDDFIAAAEWLVAEGYTAPPHLGIMGGSNGGLLVGACLVQRPDLFGAVVCTYPLLDMVRYHKFLVGQLWISDYGTCDDPAQFAYIHAYSPYHHVAEGAAYPATLFITGDGDTRVAPLHARKMAALVQARNGGGAPIMLRYHIKAGHSGGMTTDAQVDELVEILSFLKWRLTAGD